LPQNWAAGFRHDHVYLHPGRALRRAKIAQALPPALPQPGYFLRDAGESIARRFREGMPTTPLPISRRIYAARRDYDNRDMRMGKGSGESGVGSRGTRLPTPDSLFPRLVFHHNRIFQPNMRHHVADAVLGQLLDVIRLSVAAENDALRVQLNSEIANPTTSAR